MNKNIIIFIIIILIVVFIYIFFIKSEHFDKTKQTLSQSGIMLVKYKLAIMSADTLTNYFTNYNTTPNDNIYKNWLDSYLTFSTEQKKTLSPFRNSKPGNDNDTIIPINDVILEIISTDKLTNYSDELRNIIICTYLAAPDVLDTTDIVYVYKLKKSIPCNCDITLNKNYNINIKVNRDGSVNNKTPKYILDLIQSEDKYKSLSQTTKDIFNNSFNDLFKHLITNSPDDWGITVPYFISSTDLSNFKYLCARMLIIYSEEASSLNTSISNSEDKTYEHTTYKYQFNCDSCVQIYCDNNKDKLNSLALLDASFKLNGGNLKSRNLCKVSEYYYEYTHSEEKENCFIGSSLVLMADYTTKEIKDVKIDDMVISAKTGLPQKILLIDVPPITSCELYGLNEYEPFATTNHPFISHDNKLLVVDTKSAINISKHDSNIVKEIKINDIVLSFNEKIKPITVENINIKKYNDIQLYNIITEDHTFFVNNFGVHDNSFNYECYKTESLRMGLMVLLSKDIINDFTFEELFNKYHQEVMNTPLNMDDYYEYFNQVVELCHTQKCLDFLYYLWCNKFDLY